MAPRILEEHGLIPALENLFRISLSHTGIAHEFEHSGLNGRLQENVETSLYRITQELVNNILKHSGATHVKVELKRSENSIALKVAENGKGFDFEEMLHAGSSGLFNILSRVNILNGSFYRRQRRRQRNGGADQNSAGRINS
jgi:two-component system NarL family sensor kinase